MNGRDKVAIILAIGLICILLVLLLISSNLISSNSVTAEEVSVGAFVTIAGGLVGAISVYLGGKDKEQ